MALEMELKYLDVDHDELRSRLRQAGATLTDAPYFERNSVYDSPGRELKQRQVLLRLRQKKGNSVLTLKRPPAEDQPFGALKVYEELETGVGDAAVLEGIFAELGYAPAFAYEKVREKWLLDGVVVCLDLLPFGSYAELEGNEETVTRAADRLGLEHGRASRQTYHALNCQLRRERGAPPRESFVFGEDERRRLLRELE